MPLYIVMLLDISGLKNFSHIICPNFQLQKKFLRIIQLNSTLPLSINVLYNKGTNDLGRIYFKFGCDLNYSFTR